MEISLPDLYVDPRSCVNCLFVKQIRKVYNFVFNVNNLPLAPQSKRIYFNSSLRTTATTITKFERMDRCSQGAMIRVQPCTSKRYDTT